MPDLIRVRTLPFVVKAMLHTYACSTSSSQGCKGDRISLKFASVHHLVRNRTDEAHVYSEAESKVLVLCIVSFERRRLSQASQVLEHSAVITVHNTRNVEDRRSQQTGSLKGLAPPP